MAQGGVVIVREVITREVVLGRLIGGILLLALSLFMLFGFVRSGAPLASAATVIALLLGVALPAGAGIALLRARGTAAAALTERRDELRRRTIDAEVLRLAGVRGGRLTVIELMQELALSAEQAKLTLDDLMRRDIADIEVTDSGVLVYRFHDVQRLGEKDQAKGLLDG